MAVSPAEIWPLQLPKHLLTGFRQRGTVEVFFHHSWKTDNNVFTKYSNIRGTVLHWTVHLSIHT